MNSLPKPQPLLETFRSILQRRQAASTLRTLSLASPGSMDFSSNDFLSLSTSPHLRTLFLQALHASPAFHLGSGGSRLLDGNSSDAEKLERDIAAFHNAEAGLLFNSGYDANSGFFACVPQRADVVVYDELVHASVREGVRLSRCGRSVQFVHNCVQGLREVLEECVAGDEAVRRGKRNVFVAVESVYSMDGDLAPLGEIVDCLEEMLPMGNGCLIVDEAHATGVLGPGGRGRVCELGLEARVFARLHTFGKALACSGGMYSLYIYPLFVGDRVVADGKWGEAILLCATVTREYLVNYARPLIYTTFMSFPSLMAIRVVYDFMITGGTEEPSLRLQWLIRYFYTTLGTLKSKCIIPTSNAPVLHLPLVPPKSPIFSLPTPEPRSLAKYCQDGGLVVRPIVPPTVPAGGERVRVCLHAGNVEGEIERLVARIGEWLDLVREGKGKVGKARL